MYSFYNAFALLRPRVADAVGVMMKVRLTEKNII
jgi:hypothetical protein